MTDEDDPGNLIEAPPSASLILQHYLEWEATTGEDNERHKVKEGVYHLSDAWKCNRQLYYKFEGMPSENTLPLGLFAVGHFAEAKLTEAMRWFYGDEFIDKVDVQYDLGEGGMLLGRTDIIVYDKPRGDPTRKPIRQYEVKSNAKGAAALPGAHQKHQAAGYAKLLDIPDTRVVHPARNNLTNMPAEDWEMPLALRDRYFEEVVQQFKTLHWHRRNKRLPSAKPYMKFECGYCPFLNQCRKDGGWTQGPRGGTVLIEKPLEQDEE